jgi:putative protease
MIDKIPDLAEAGVYSLKIEGRMKSMYYVATVVSAYRAAIDAYLADPDSYVFDKAWFEELCKASHREFTHGFYYNKPTDKDQNYLTSEYIRDYSFVGLVRETDPASGLTTVEQRNKFGVGDTVEIFGPRTPYYEEVIKEMYNEEGESVESAPHPQQILRIRFDRTPEEGFIIRKKKMQ